jgi:hypothetical protein
VACAARSTIGGQGDANGVEGQDSALRRQPPRCRRPADAAFATTARREFGYFDSMTVTPSHSEGGGDAANCLQRFR